MRALIAWLLLSTPAIAQLPIPGGLATLAGSRGSSGQVEAPVWDSHVIDVHLNGGQSVDLSDYVTVGDRFELVASSEAPNDPFCALGVNLNESTGVISSTYEGAETYCIWRVRAKNGSANETADQIAWWAEVTTRPDVINVADFPDEDSVRDVSDIMGGHEAGSQWDSSTTAFGLDGSLDQSIIDSADYPECTPGPGCDDLPEGTEAEANWGMFFNADGVTRYGTGEPITFVVAYMVNRAWLWQPAGSGGKKLHIIANGPDAPSCMGYSRVLQDTQDRGIIQGYHYQSGGSASCSTLTDWDTNIDGGLDITFQPSIDRGDGWLSGNDPATGMAWATGLWSPQRRARYGGTYNYYSVNEAPDGYPDPLTGAFIVPFDQLFLIEETIEYGTPGNDNSYRRVRGLNPGQSWVTIYERSNEDAGAILTSDGGAGGFHITNSTTGMDPEIGVRPTIHTWTLGAVVFAGRVNVPVLGTQMKSSDAIVTVRLN